MPRIISVGVLSFALVALGATAARADHVPPDATLPSPILDDVPVLSTGDVRYISNAQAGAGVAAPFGERGPFTRDGRRYLAPSSTSFGLHVLDVTDPFAPEIVSGYGAAFGCPSAITEAGRPSPWTPLAGWENDQSVTPDGMMAVLGMDAPGRCHDPVHGGLEFVDLSDLTHPRPMHLTRNVGEAHSVTIDPERPWLAYLSSTDSANFIDVVDFKDCPAGSAPARCSVTVARIPFTERHWPNLASFGGDVATNGCHDIRLQGDLLYCAAVGQTSILDVSGIVGPDGELTGTHLTEGKHACTVTDAVRTDRGVRVTDCRNWTEALFADSKAIGADVELLSIILHDGSRPAERDIEIAHQAEPTHDGRIMFVTDERGGGLTNARGCPGGGVSFYDIRDKTKPVLMQQADGSPAIYITELNLPGTAHMSCTVHYGEQVGNEDLFVFGWYLNGARAVRINPDWSTSPPTLRFEEVAAYLAAGGVTIQAKPMGRNPANPDELIVYTADESRGTDVLGMTIPKLRLKGPVKETKVLGSTRSDGGKPLPRTGTADSATWVLLLATAAAFITRRLHAAR